MKKKIKVGIIVCIIFIVGMILFYLFSPYGKIQDIKVLGKSQFTKNQLVQMAKIDQSKNIFFISLRDAQHNLLENPLIKEAKLKRVFPFEISIAIAERPVVAMIPISSGFAYLDNEARIIKMTQDKQDLIVPLITGLDLKEVKLGDIIRLSDNENQAKLLALIETAQNADLLDVISDIHVQDMEQIKLYTIQGLEVWVGNGDLLSKKLLYLQKILPELHARKVYTGIVDMRYNQYPIYRKERDVEQEHE